MINITDSFTNTANMIEKTRLQITRPTNK